MARPVTDLQRTVAPFRVVSEYQPAGDQPAAIEEISRRIEAGAQDVVLLAALVAPAEETPLTRPGLGGRPRGSSRNSSGRRW